MFGRVLLVALAAAQAQDPPVVELDSAGDQTSAPDGVDGFRVHRVRPPLDGRRGRGDPRRGPMSDHNFDEDHWLAPTNPRTAFALHHAAALGDVDQVMRLLRGCTEAHMRNCNETAFGVHPDAKESAFLKTALHRAAEHDRYDVAVELLKYNASVNVTDKQFWTPLHKTAEKGWLEFSRLLVLHHADVGAVDKYGWTPLHRACANGRLEVAKLLSAYGSPLDHGKASLGHFFPDVHAYANQDGTPLHAAAVKGHDDVVAWLVGAGADIDARDKYGWMPLHKACEAGQFEAARTLVALGAQKNTRGVVGGTPLQIARSNGYPEIAAMLASAGATTQTPLGEGLRSNLPHLNAEAYCKFLYHSRLLSSSFSVCPRIFTDRVDVPVPQRFSPRHTRSSPPRRAARPRTKCPAALRSAPAPRLTPTRHASHRAIRSRAGRGVCTRRPSSGSPTSSSAYLSPTL